MLRWVARFGVVPRLAVALRASTGRSVTYDRERRLRLQGLIEVHASWEGPLLTCTRTGLGVAGREDLYPARPSPWRDRHPTIVCQLAARLERSGERLLSEREIGSLERARGEQLLSVSVSERRWHRPDLIRLGARPEAIEVELTPKAPRRLDRILGAWQARPGDLPLRPRGRALRPPLGRADPVRG